MIKKLSSVIVSIFLLLSMLPVQAIAATTIGEDVSRSLPILAEMETATEASAINTQITSAGGTAQLTQDRVEGNYAVSVEVGDIANETDIKYILKDSATFNIDNYSQVKLWVKPGEGAQWAEFYIRDTDPTPNEVAIKSDSDQDGVYVVGVDLVSGQWNQLTLDLTNIATSLTQGQDLVVKTNDDSTWYYDSIKSVHTSVTSLDLSHMVNSRTEISNGSLQFKTNGDNTFDTTPTILVSNRYPSFSKTDTTQVDFNAGTLDNAEATGEGSVKFTQQDQTTDGSNAISGGDYGGYTSSNAFDNSLSTSWYSSQSGSTITTDPAFIGNDFGQLTTVHGFTIKQHNNSNYGVNSVTLQYYDGDSWENLQTFSLSNTTLNLQEFRVDKLVAATKWRLKPNTNLPYYWRVYEIEFLKYGTYTSPVVDISSLTSASNSKIAWETNEGAKLKVETRVSDNNGNTWQPDWTTVTSGGEIPGFVDLSSFTNAQLQYRVSIDQPLNIAVPTLPELNEINIEIIGDYQNITALPTGKISSIAIESRYSSVLRSGLDLREKTLYLTNEKPTVFAFSGDGSKLFYANPNDNNKLYMLDLNTGETSRKSEWVGDKIKANYDGNIVAFKNNSNFLYYYNNNLTDKESVISSYVTYYDIQKDGTVFYIETSGTAELHKYTPDGTDTVIYNSNNYPIAIAKEADVGFYTNSTYLHQMELVAGSWKFNNILNASSTIQDIWTNDTGSLVYLKYGDSLYCVDIQSKVLRKLDLPQYISPQRVTEDNQLFVQDSLFDIMLYNPNTDKSYSIKPSDAKQPTAYTTLYFDVNSDGNKMAYVSQDSSGNINGIKASYFNGVKRPERYLLSFDGKKSWYTYQGGNWIHVTSALTPSTADFATYGLTVDEVKALSEADFASLYDDNREIYSFDVAVYYASVDPYTTPSLKSIKVTVNQDSTATEYLDKPLYAAKEKTIDATSWFKINKLYPVEVAPREAQYYYFIRLNGGDNLYRTYKNGVWVVEPAGDKIYTNMLADVEANWIDISQNGMTAAELRAIPASDLDALVGTNFSVVYAMKVNDTKTNEYTSLISADYVQDLFSGASYTLKVTLSDGTLKQYTSLTDNDVENFMEWINGRQYEMGQVFYQLTTATGKDFLNYFKIQAVTVE